MKLFFIFPLKGPTNGVKVISKYVLEKFQEEKDIDIQIVDTSQATDYSDFGKFNLNKISFIFKLLSSIRGINKNDLAYMNFSTKGFSFYRDIIILSYLNFKDANVTIHIHANGLEKWKNSIIRKNLNRSKIVVINSKQLASLSHFKNVFYVKNVLPDFYDGNFKILEEKSEDARLLYFSNLSVQKGIDCLKGICKLIHSKALNYKLTICGGVLDQYSQNVLDELIAEYNFVTYLGPIDDESTKMKLFKNHDFLLFLSEINYEVYPLVYIEALMNGLPIITTQQIVAEEVIANNSGFLLTNHDIEKYISTFEKPKLLYTTKLMIRARFEKEYCFNDYYSQIKKIILK